MPARELIGKTLAFGISAALFIVCGALVLSGSHAANDYLNFVLGWTLVGLGGLTILIGVSSIGLILYENRAEKREAQLHVTPRSGEPGLPPAWGMGTVGRIEVGGDQTSAKGGAKVMSVAVNNLDAPLFVGLLLVWTVVALILFAPK